MNEGAPSTSAPGYLGPDPGTGDKSPTAAGGPTGAGSSETNTSGAVAPGTAPAPVPPPVEVRAPLATRISKTEYAASVLDVLGVSLSVAELDADEGGLPDDAGDGVFKRFGDKQTTVERHATGFLALSRIVASRADIQALQDRFGVCSDATLACVSAALEAVGERLFRRPLDERETSLYASVGRAALSAGETFEESVRWGLTALLQAPPFLFQMIQETNGSEGTVADLSSFELGARLASFIWNSVPDSELLAAAADGSLLTPGVLEQQAQRMLQDEKAKRLTESFIRDYSRAERASFLGASDADRDALRESVVATFQYLTWEANVPLQDMFTTTEYVVNQRTAELLQLPRTGPSLTRVDVSALPERVGILTHPGVIAGMGDQETGSFVNRGKFLMERLLCRHPAAVPAALAAELEAFNADTTGLNEHERLALRQTRPECWGCHAQFEPFALGFARFDGAGRYVGETDDAGKPLPLDGWVPIGAGSDESFSYSDVREYMTILQNAGEIRNCMVQHFMSYATSYSPDGVTRTAAAQLDEELATTNPTLSLMVERVVSSALFRKYIVQAPSTTAAGGN